MMKKMVLMGAMIALLSGALWAQDAKDPLEHIRKEGMDNSQVMDIASWMTDVYGPRLTGSDMLDKATGWALDRLKAMGLQNVHTEEWGPFGRGWELEHFEMHAVAPSYFPVMAYPRAWSPSTNGMVQGEVVYLQANNAEDLEKYRGQLKGKFVLLDTLRTVSENFDGHAKRFSDSELLEMANAPAPTPRSFRGFRGSGANFRKALWDFFWEEQPAVVLDRAGKGDLGTVFVSGTSVAEGRPQNPDAKVVPQATVSIEHYNRIFRLLQKGIKVELAMELKTRYTNPDGMQENIIAEIPGTDLKDEVVIFGAHFDSWHAGTGATDNAAGSSVMMEAARILVETIKASGIQPRRTLRIALWTGEEQGLYGSRAYVQQHYANTDAQGNLQSLKAENEKVSAYYNIDNGTGKIRGVYLQGNAAAGTVFRDWLEPFKDLGASTLTLSNTGGTDHLSFDAVGIPGFQFIQDPMAYSTRTHHSNMDNWDHLVADDLKQMAVIVASFVWQTSQRDQKIPRKPLPEGVGTDQ